MKFSKDKGIYIAAFRNADNTIGCAERGSVEDLLQLFSVLVGDLHMTLVRNGATDKAEQMQKIFSRSVELAKEQEKLNEDGGKIN